MGRILAVDVGDVRTGLAMSDVLGITCSPLRILHEKRRGVLVAAIQDIAEANQVESIVVGLPRPLGAGATTNCAVLRDSSENCGRLLQFRSMFGMSDIQPSLPLEEGLR